MNSPSKQKNVYENLTNCTTFSKYKTKDVILKMSKLLDIIRFRLSLSNFQATCVYVFTCIIIIRITILFIGM